ncbi:Uncharacterized protein T4B_12612 [Trichinella pseudospiralis]|uniref:NADAR domain-containing protein n=1 Tax=Trichinella pseudospiralis TaxID=6337 RepID=A0A0V1JE18_TRIPS|nr:Uncharacterized protein T4B_12612 [Trichinella pseudospiralis]
MVFKNTKLKTTNKMAQYNVITISKQKHPLSVFHEYSVKINGNLYLSFIHFWAEKLLHELDVGDWETKRNVNAASAVDAYSIVMNVVLNSNIFHNKKQYDVVNGLVEFSRLTLVDYYKESFSQNLDLKNILLSLEDGIIVECSADWLFGISGDEHLLRKWLLQGCGMHFSETDLLESFSILPAANGFIPAWWGTNINGLVLMHLRRKFLGLPKLSCSLFSSEDKVVSFKQLVDRFFDSRETFQSSSTETNNVWKKDSFDKLKCGENVYSFEFLTLERCFAPLSTTFEMPVVAGETLYYTIEHYIAAQFLRDMNRMDAAKEVKSCRRRNRLRLFINEICATLPPEDIQKWRSERMLSAFKKALERKFDQYSELKDLLLETGTQFLLEVNSFDKDWSIGMNSVAFENWCQKEDLKPATIVFWLTHPSFRPSVLGANINGMLLMEMRNRLMPVMYRESCKLLSCPLCNDMDNGESSVSVIENAMFVNADSPLSFDYLATFQLDGASYSTVDQYVKARVEEQFANTVGHAFADARWVWLEQHGLKLYRRALVAKFSQNEHCRLALLGSGNALLVVPAVDRWCPSSFGCAHASQRAFVVWTQRNGLSVELLRRYWTQENLVPSFPKLGSNKLGILLMEVREEFRCRQETFHCLDIETVPLARLCTSIENESPLERCSEQLVLVDDGPLGVTYFEPFQAAGLIFYSVDHFHWFALLVQLLGGNEPLGDIARRLLSEPDPNHVQDLVRDYVTSRFGEQKFQSLLWSTEREAIYEAAWHCKAAQWSASRRSWPSGVFLASDRMGSVLGAGVRSLFSLRRWMDKWRVDVETLIDWWREESPNYRPWAIGANRYGMLLMRVRGEDAQLQTRRGRDKQQQQQQQQQLGDTGDCEPVQVLAFDSTHMLAPGFSCGGVVTADGKKFQSPLHCYWFQCLRALGMGHVGSSVVQLASAQRCQTAALNAIDHAGRTGHWLRWRASTAGLAAIRHSARARFVSDGNWTRALRQTGTSLLVYCDAVEDGWLSFGMDRDKLSEFCMEVGVNASLLFHWMRGHSSAPKCFGVNHWGLALMDIRNELCAVDQVSGRMVKDLLLIPNIFMKIKDVYSSADDVRPTGMNQRGSDVLFACRYPWMMKFGYDKSKESMSEHVLDNIVDLREAHAVINDCDEEDHNLLKMVERSVFEPCINLDSLFTDAERSYTIGQSMAEKFSELFDPYALDFEGMVNDDLYNLGRVASYWVEAVDANYDNDHD